MLGLAPIKLGRLFEIHRYIRRSFNPVLIPDNSPSFRLRARFYRVNNGLYRVFRVLALHLVCSYA